MKRPPRLCSRAHAKAQPVMLKRPLATVGENRVFIRTWRGFATGPGMKATSDSSNSRSDFFVDPALRRRAERTKVGAPPLEGS